MGKYLLRQIKYRSLEHKFAFLVFWSVIALVLLVEHTQILGYFTGLEISSGRYTDVFVAVIIYFLVTGIEDVHYSFPHLLSLGSTRRHYWLGKISFFILLAIVMTTLQMTVLGLESLLGATIDSWVLEMEIGHAGFFFFQLLVCLVTGMVFSLLATLYYSKGKLIILLVILILFSIPVMAGLIEGNIIAFVFRSLFFFAWLEIGYMQILLVSMVVVVGFLIEWILLRRMDLH